MDHNWRWLLRPLAAIALGLAPFWLFFGPASETRVNGVVVQDSQLNLAGLVLAVAGAGIAIGLLRQKPRQAPRVALAVLALLVCLVQIADSSELLPLSRLRTALLGPPLPALDPAAGLSAADRARIEADASRPTIDEVTLRDELVTVGKRLQTRRAEHLAYAGLCHGGRSRLPPPALPAWLAAADRLEIEAAAEAPRSATPPPCSAAASALLMGTQVERGLRDRDLMTLLQSVREARFGSAAPAGPAPAWRLEGAPVAIGEAWTAVQARLGLTATPEAVEPVAATPKLRTRLSVAPGVTAFFDGDDLVSALLLEEGFTGSLGGVRPTQTASSVLRRLGPPLREVALAGGIRGLLYMREVRHGEPAATEAAGVQAGGNQAGSNPAAAPWLGPVPRFDMRDGSVVALVLMR